VVFLTFVTSIGTDWRYNIMEKAAGTFATFQLFRVSGLGQQLRALKDMGLRSAQQVKDLPVFGRHMGSGSGSGFSMWPDWSSFAFIAVWRNRDTAEAHLSGDNYTLPWANYCEESLQLLLSCTQVHGAWDGSQPLSVGREYSGGPLAVLTRAKVRLSRAHRFWRYVPQAGRAIEAAQGCQFTKGIGEWPLMMQATLSIWDSSDALHRFAYEDREHREIVEMTRKEKWYSEELFARFEILSQAGSYRKYKA
jgi:hypothetical protein